MADKKISQLTTLAQADVAVTADFLPIVDTSATETKKATPQSVVLGALGATSANVGIGTASPAQRLTVQGPSNQAFLLTQDSTGAFQGIYGADSAIGGAVLGSLSNHPVIFRTNNTERMRLDSSGNLGIGTASPSVASGIGIAVNGGASAARLALKNNSTGDASMDGFQLAVSGSDAFIEQRENASLILSTNGVERMRLDQNGNVIAGGSVALATNATNGFLYVPTCAGVPTGTPGVITGMVPIVVDTTNNRWYFYSGGAWRNAGP